VEGVKGREGDKVLFSENKRRYASRFLLKGSELSSKCGVTSNRHNNSVAVVGVGGGKEGERGGQGAI
jgi:hypothetical protein